MTADPLETLRRMHEEQKRQLFPQRTPNEPAGLREFGMDLYAEWAELDGFVAGLAQRALRGERLTLKQVEPYGPRYEELKQKLQVLEREYSDSARPIVDVFRFLERILDVLRSLAKDG